MSRIRPERWIWYGWAACWAFIAVLAVVMVGEYLVVAVSQKDLPLRYIAPVQDLVYCGLFLVFLGGIRGFALLRKDTELTKTANTLLVISLIEVIVMFPYAFADYFNPSFLTILLVSMFPLLCVNGIVLLRLADNFNSYTAEFGAQAKRVVFWNRVAGWMLASVILAWIGVFVSLLGEFFLWRFLAKVIKHNYQTQTVATLGADAPTGTVQ